MKFPTGIRVYGDKSYRGHCATENQEQATLFAELRRRWPDTIGRLALHPRNEGKRHYRQYAIERAEGMSTGASDVIIPGDPCIVLELKRRDHTRSKLSKAELEYLDAAQAAGAVVGVALGWEAAISAIEWATPDPALMGTACCGRKG